MTTQDIATVALPFVAASHVFCSAMGYHYATRARAWAAAWRVFALISAVSVALMLARHM
jgi:hypothetical protein